jgi:hypothetical protein
MAVTMFSLDTLNRCTWFGLFTFKIMKRTVSIQIIIYCVKPKASNLSCQIAGVSTSVVKLPIPSLYFNW